MAFNVVVIGLDGATFDVMHASVGTWGSSSSFYQS